MIKLTKISAKEYFKPRRRKTIVFLVNSKNHRLVFIHMQDIDMERHDTSKHTGDCAFILHDERVREKENPDEGIAYYTSGLSLKYLKYLYNLK